MRETTPTDLYYLAQTFQGEIDHIYLHWTAGHYGQFFDDYHINIDSDGSIYLTTDDLTDILAHTWHRNTRSIGISMACCVGACANHGYDADFGEEGPTEAQINVMGIVVDVLCAGLGLDINEDTVMTHCEAAEEDDYGPSTTCERWDLWYLPDDNGKMVPGGNLLRDKARWYKAYGY
jgi:hypothetical protein